MRFFVQLILSAIEGLGMIKIHFFYNLKCVLDYLCNMTCQ